MPLIKSAISYTLIWELGISLYTPQQLCPFGIKALVEHCMVHPSHKGFIYLWLQWICWSIIILFYRPHVCVTVTVQLQIYHLHFVCVALWRPSQSYLTMCGSQLRYQICTMVSFLEIAWEFGIVVLSFKISILNLWLKMWMITCKMHRVTNKKSMTCKGSQSPVHIPLSIFPTFYTISSWPILISLLAW